MSALDAPMPSKRAKSTRARDMLYGRQGGRRAPLQTDAEQAAAFAEAVANGSIVRAACFCTYWWLVDKDEGSACGHCGEAMVAVAADVDTSLHPCDAALAARNRFKIEEVRR